MLPLNVGGGNGVFEFISKMKAKPGLATCGGGAR
jgi:hypothetical protein